MMTFMVICCVVVFALLLMVTAIEPRRARLSAFELGRRSEAGDSVATAELARDTYLNDIISIQRVLTALLLVIFVLLCVTTFGWLLGIAIAVVVALEYGALSRMAIVKKHSQKLYETHESSVINIVTKMGGFAALLRSASPPPLHDTRVDSREELEHLVSSSHGIISDDEKKLILHSLTFTTRLVSEIMTPRGVIDSISKKELLGPLVLDDLHKTGHSRFPVVDGDIDHIVGMLYIQDLFTLDSKRSTTAEKAMDPRVYYIHQDQTLSHALAAFLKSHHHLFVVVNEFRETVGLISLEDVTEALIGRKIIDEFDTHEDLRAVAARNPRGNNHPPRHVDV